MTNDHLGNPIDEGERAVVVAGTHKGKQGKIEDLHLSKTGAFTVTIRQDDGDRFKTLAKNLAKV